MPDAVAAVLGEEQRPGVPWILNDPYRGGTHLPDVTLISPVFVAGELLGFAASRAHHADIGGPTPGGMPAFSKTLAEEGVVIPPTRADEATLERAGRADARAAPAARRPARPAGRQPDRRAAASPSSPSATAPSSLRAGMAEILAYSERRTRAALAALPDGTYSAEDVLEDDSPSGRARRRPAGRGDDRRRAPAARLRRHRRPGRRQPQLPALGDQVGRLLRRPRPHRPRRAALRPAPTARSRSSPRPAACSTPSSRPRSPPATSRPPAGSPTW